MSLPSQRQSTRVEKKKTRRRQTIATGSLAVKLNEIKTLVDIIATTFKKVKVKGQKKSSPQRNSELFHNLTLLDWLRQSINCIINDCPRKVNSIL